jgi:peptidoglycan hydrolase-like protein with peptidoglycan-binding domain
MFDATDISQIPPGAVAVAGYVDGLWVTYPGLVAQFPHADVLSIAVTAEADAECLDIETGDATPADAAAWYERQRARGISRPCLYASASLMETDVVPVITAAGIDRAAVRLWSAHYAGQHICGPSSCGLTSIDMDGTQWTDQAGPGGGADESLLLADFFGDQPPPRPAPAPPWQEAIVNVLPVLQLGSRDAPGRVEFVHRAQALAAVIGTINHLPAAEGLALDGSFGPATAAAVAAVQAHFAIAADSVVGTVTWSVLVTGSAP